jgi:hypothetical protein
MTNRRTFLASLGAAILSGRLLEGRALAQSRAAAKRLIVFFSPNGSVLRHWRPTGGETNFSFEAGTILEPLAPIKDKLVVVDGLDFFNASNHEGGMGAMLTGGGGAGSASGGASVDQYVASQLASGTRFPSLELGVHTSAWGGGVQTRMSYQSAGQFVAPDDEPARVARRLFGNAGAPVDALYLKRKSVLDLVRAELGDLKQQLGNDERVKLEAHLDALRQSERGLMTGGNADTCAGPPAFTLDAQANDNFPAVGRAQTDLMVAALACDQTRVASIQYSHTVSPTVFSWLGISEGHHALSHMDDGNAAGVMQFVLAERWFAEQFRYLVERLDALPEPGGTGSLLDHSLVVWAKEMGDSRLHECRSVPFVLAGGAGGALRTGRYLRYPGQAHNRLLVSVCQLMGLNNPTFGDPAGGTGTLEGLIG